MSVAGYTFVSLLILFMTGYVNLVGVVSYVVFSLFMAFLFLFDLGVYLDSNRPTEVFIEEVYDEQK